MKVQKRKKVSIGSLLCSLHPLLYRPASVYCDLIKAHIILYRQRETLLEVTEAFWQTHNKTTG